MLTYREMALSQDKIRWLWQEMNKIKTLFSDYTRGNMNNFLAIIADPMTYWLEVVDEQEHIIGIMYLTGLDRVIDANIHVVFFDRRPAEKKQLCREMIRHIFDRFPSLHRITASMPSTYYATVRLCRDLDFSFEGTKREASLIGGKWINEISFGLLAESATNGRHKESPATEPSVV